MYIVTAPRILRKLFPPFLIWDMPNSNNEIYLTFDDGPHPVATPFVLKQLDLFDAKATFFCIGKNVVKYPLIYEQIINLGHTVGNHTFDHLNGRKTRDEKYLSNIDDAANLIHSKLFRPPYGSIKRLQARQLKEAYSIIMWSVLSADFDTTISKEKCLRNVVENTKPGSVIVFHDSEKAFPHLQYVLPKSLEYFSEKGFKMRAINR